MTPEAVVEAFQATGALLEGHFLYTSGRHGRQFLQAARVLQYPRHTEALCAAMAEAFRDDRVELVVGPATGGIVLAYETARRLQCRAAYTERDEAGGMALKRGISVLPGARVLVVEDIITTGGSVKKSIAHLCSRGAQIVGVAALIDRSGGEVSFNCRFSPLAVLRMESWPVESCPLCAQGRPLIEPDDIIA